MSRNAQYRWLRLALSPVLAAAVSFSAAAQAPDSAAVSQPEATLGAALRSLASRAGVVFVGQVTAIERSGEVMLVHFRVDQAVLGDAPNPYILREWAGLWPPGEQRYYPGQRALVFLHSPAGSGFSSPVDGAEGVVPVIPQGADQTPLVDTRRLDTRLLRSVGDPLPDASSSAVLLTDVTPVVQRWREPTWQEPVRHPLPVEAAPPPAASTGTVTLQAPEPLAPISPHRLIPSVPGPPGPSPSNLKPPAPLPEGHVGR